LSAILPLPFAPQILLPVCLQRFSRRFTCPGWAERRPCCPCGVHRGCVRNTAVRGAHDGVHRGLSVCASVRLGLLDCWLYDGWSGVCRWAVSLGPGVLDKAAGATCEMKRQSRTRLAWTSRSSSSAAVGLSRWGAPRGTPSSIVPPVQRHPHPPNIPALIHSSC
jgi:hypothetical protein